MEFKGHFPPSGAEISVCGKYRWCLWRYWGKDLHGNLNVNIGKKLTFIMLNPSTADATSDDPTLKRCKQRAIDMGFSAVELVNLFAFRATSPKDLKKYDEPIGILNDRKLLKSVQDSDMVICAWGGHGDHLNRHNEVVNLLNNNSITLHALSLTTKGMPGHPLYIPYDKKPFLWEPRLL